MRISTRDSRNMEVKAEGSRFQNLPDELVIEIFTRFTRLSNSDAPCDTLNDLKLLGRCSTVCKRFNSLVCMVPTLTIKHPCCKTLYDLCPKILNKFKDIRSLQVKHWSCPEILMHNRHDTIEDPPTVLSYAVYRPHSYWLAVVSYKCIQDYLDQERRDDLLLWEGDDYLHASAREHTIDLIRLHHMLISSIRDHKYLQMVQVTDFNDQRTFTLEEDILAELRNCSSVNLEQVQGRDMYSPLINLDNPLSNVNTYGFVFDSACFNIIEWSEKSADDHTLVDYADPAEGIPTCLPFEGEEETLLQALLKNPLNVRVNDNKILLGLLSDIKSDGNLI